MSIFGLCFRFFDKNSCLGIQDSRLRKSTISFGHNNWDFAENMLFAIRNSMMRLVAEEGLRPLQHDDFEAKQESTIERLVPINDFDSFFFKKKFREITFTFVAFCPLVFNEIRTVFRIDFMDFLVISFVGVLYD